MTMKWLEPSDGSSEPTYLYDNPALHPVKLKGIYITQHSRKIRTVSAPVRDLDRISRTPEIGDRDNRSMHDLFLQHSIPWQRKLNMSRVPDIRSWWMNQASTSANGALIFLENLCEFSDSEGVCSLTMDPDRWTFTMCPGDGGVCGWSPAEISASFSGWAADVCPKCGYTDKPGIVVDGQHRLRGMSSDPDGQEQELVFASVVTRFDGFNRSMVSKIFTEVTSSAVSLDKLHQEFLSAKYDLAPRYDANTTEGANLKRAYGIAASLNNSATRWGNTTAQRKGRVEMIERRPSIPCDTIDVKRMAEYIYSWMEHTVEISGGSIVPLGGMNDDEIRLALEQFLETALVVWPGNPYWQKGRSPIGALQTRGVFRMLLHLFKLITARLRIEGLDLDMVNYNKELEHIQNIMWTSPGWREVYTRQDSDQNRTRNVLTHIYDIAPNPLGNTTPIPSLINDWMGQAPEKVKLLSCVADAGMDNLSIEFESSFSASGGPRTTVSWPLKAKSTARMTITNHNTGKIANSDVKSNICGTSFSSLEMSPSPGDNLEIEIQFTAWSSSPTILKFTKQVV